MPILDMGRINLVVPDDLEKNAVIFTSSTLRPTTANNDINYYRGLQMDTISSRWLNAASGGSATAWFLVCTLPAIGVPLCVYSMGGPAYLASPPESGTWNLTFAVKNRYAVGNTEWKGVQGTSGAGS